MKDNIAEIIDSIETYNGVFPREELQSLRDNSAEATSVLLNCLSDIERLYARLETEPDYILPFYALFLLAEFRETKAYPLVHEIFSYDGETVDEIWGDMITEDLGRILASVSGGDVSLINDLIISEADIYEYVRSSALNAWFCLVRANLKTREEFIAFLKTLFELSAEEDDFLRTSVINACLDIRAEELFPEIKKSFDDEVVDLMMMGDWDDFQELWADEKITDYTADNRHYDLIDDTITELGGWNYFKSEEDKIKDKEKFETALNRLFPPESQSEKVFWNSDSAGTFEHLKPKIGKNDPCFCGSGRKYKKCCLLK